MKLIFEKILLQHKVVQLQLIDYLSAFLAFCISFCVYIFCMTPGVPAGDGGELAVAIHYLGVGHAPGYPLHSLLGKLFTVFPWGGSVAWKTNVFSGFCASIAVFFTTLISIRILLGVGESVVRSRFFGGIGGLFLGFFPVFWSQAIFCEVYSVGIVFQIVILWVLLLWVDEVFSHRLENTVYMGQGHLLAISFLFGVAIVGHLSVVMMQILVGGTILGILSGVVFSQKKLTVQQVIHGKKCVFFLLMCLSVLLCGILATVVGSDSIGVGSNYGLGDIKKIIYIFLIPNIALAFMYWVFHNVIPEKLDPQNFLQKGTFVVIQMFFLLYLGYFVNTYLYIRGNANPPINWGGIGESSDFLEKLSKFLSVIFRKQYGDQGRVPVSLDSVFFSLEWILQVLFSQVNWPLIFLMGLGAVVLFQTHFLYAAIVVGGFFTFTLQMAVYLRIQDALWSQVSRVFFLFSLVPMSVLCCLGCSQVYKYCLYWRQKSLAMILFLGIIFIDTPLWSGFFSNGWIQNNRRQDQVCQNYAKDMLDQCPSGSILLTEGPDNEVFPLLYYRYVEKVRLDMDIFDQKGNIFPRIYGNFFAPSYPRFKESYDLVRDLRDFQLCSTGKPVFWAFERDLKDINYESLKNRYQNLIQQYPFLKNSVLGIWSKDFTKTGLKKLLSSLVPRSVFDGVLAGQENLYDLDQKELGPWFLRQEGILYRVWPVRFAPLYILECVEKATKSEILKGIHKGLKVPLIQFENQLQLYLDQLLQQGFIKKSRNEVYSLVKTPWSTTVDWESTYAVLQNYLPLHKKIIHWDYLIPEVFVEYAKEILQDLFRKNRIRFHTLGGIPLVTSAEEEKRLKLFYMLFNSSIDLRGFSTFYEEFWNNLKDEKKQVSKEWVERYQSLFNKFYPVSASVSGYPLLGYVEQQKKYWIESSPDFIAEFKDWVTIFNKYKKAVSFFHPHKGTVNWFNGRLEEKIQYNLWEETARMQKYPELLQKINQQVELPFFKILQANLYEQQGNLNLAIENVVTWIKQDSQEIEYIACLLELVTGYRAQFDLQKLGYMMGLSCLNSFGQNLSSQNLTHFKQKEYLEIVSHRWKNVVRNLVIFSNQKGLTDIKEMIFKDISQLISLYKTVKLRDSDYWIKKKILNTLLQLYKDCVYIISES